ncbi:MAG: hypothetical protein ACJ8F7_11160 [Gemmataceae bacterium]
MPPTVPSRRARRIRLAALVLVPLAAAGGWFAIQPGNRLRCPHDDYLLLSAVYDEFDLTAMALRGLNAEHGRQAGRAENPFEGWYEPPLARRLGDDVPLRPRYFLEYPHAALLLFRAGYWVQPSARDRPVPPAVIDGDYHDIAMYCPQTEAEEGLWRCFVTATRFYVVVMLVCLFLLMAILEWGYGPGTGLAGGSLLLLMPALLYFTLNRFDVVPALLTAVSLACLGRKWHTASALALAAAVLVKVYPVLLAPLVLRYLWADRRAAGRWAAAFASGCSLVMTPLLFGEDLQAVIAPYQFQLTRPPELGMTIYGCLLPVPLGVGALGVAFRGTALAGTAVALLWRPVPDLASLLRRGTLLLLVFVSLPVFYSPQWVVWFAPLLFPLVRRDRRLGASFAGLDVVTYLTFPVWFFIVPELLGDLMRSHLPESVFTEWYRPVLRSLGFGLRLLRFAACGVLAWQLVRAEWPSVLTGSWLARRLPRVAGFLMQKV